MRYLIILLCVLALGGCATKKTMWIGHPVISDNDNYTPSQGWLTSFQIGFREDGIVVWKELED